MKRDLILEILAENLPARSIAPAEAALLSAAGAALKTAEFVLDGIETCGTYKRIVLHARGLSYHGNHGGRAASSGPAARVLAGLLPGLISGLALPGTGARSSGPVRRLLALYGDKVVPFSFAGSRSGRITEGLSAKGSRPLSVPSAEAYFRLLEGVNVLVRDSDRAKVLYREIEHACRRMKLEAESDPEALNELLYLTEHPVCVVGSYAEEFLRLPSELLCDVMRKRLRFLPLRDARGKLQPYFIGVRDGVSRGQRNVQEGFQTALSARLMDADFLSRRAR